MSPINAKTEQQIHRSCNILALPYCTSIIAFRSLERNRRGKILLSLTVDHTRRPIVNVVITYDYTGVFICAGNLNINFRYEAIRVWRHNADNNNNNGSPPRRRVHGTRLICCLFSAVPMTNRAYCLAWFLLAKRIELHSASTSQSQTYGAVWRESHRRIASVVGA